jgi:hypothetical protein
MNTFDTARKIVHMPGIKLEASIEPTRISTRVKKSAQKMIRSGILNGGYRSTARMLATQLSDDAKIAPSASATKWGAMIYNATLTPDTKTEISTLLEAARMIELSTEFEHNKKYTNDRYERARKSLHHHSTATVRITCYVPAIAQQIAEVAATSRTAEQVAACNALADRLDDVAPIKINFYTPI